MEGFKGKKIPQIHVNEHLLDDICFHKSIPFFSGTSSTTRKHISNRNLEPFSVRETSRFNFIREVFDTRDRELVQHHDVYAEIKAADPKYCPERIQTNYGHKKGVTHSNNKGRCSAGNLDDLLWKDWKSRYADLSSWLKLFGCSLNFWRLCNVLRLGSEVCNYVFISVFCTQPAFYSQSAVCILHSVCILPLVRNLQSAVRSLYITLTI